MPHVCEFMSSRHTSVGGTKTHCTQAALPIQARQQSSMVAGEGVTCTESLLAKGWAWPPSRPPWGSVPSVQGSEHVPLA